MSTVTFVPVYIPAYVLEAPTDTLSVTSTGTVGPGGVASGISNNYTVVNSGRIGTSGGNTGVLIFRGGTVINNLGASITGGVTGVDLGSGYQGRGTHTSFGSVVNNGSIAGGTGDGIYLGDNLLQGAFVTNGGTGNTGALVSGANGIDDVAGVFATIDATIDNFGTIQGTGGVGFTGIRMDDGTPSTIVNGSSLDTAALISGYIGVDGAADGPMVMQNFGTIEGTGSIAVLLGSSADTLIDEAHAVFIGTVDGAGGTLKLAGDAGAGTLTGIGTSFTNFSNVSINSGATWTLTGANTIASGATLIDGGTLIDTGSISGGINLAANGALLSITSIGTVSNAATGSAVYSRYAVSVFNQGTIDVQAPGPSVAGYYGVHLANGGSINNSGTITGNNFAGLRVLGGVSVTNSGLIASGRAGVFADFGVSIDNTGTIHGPVNGVFARNGAATITNSGMIYGNNAIWLLNGLGTISNAGTLEGLADRAVLLASGGTVTNQAGGLITAPGNNIALYIGGANYTGTASGVVTNAGTITGGTGIAFYAGDTLNQTVIDSGTIIGSSGTAIAFSAGNDTLSLQPSDSVFIQGTVDGGGGTNTLEFASGAATGTLTGVGADFVGFTNGTVDAGASWVVEGSNTLGAGMTLASSGTLIDAGTLVNEGTLLALGQPLQVTSGGSLINAGSIGGNPGSGAAVSVAVGGFVTNQASGVITGYTGIAAAGAAVLTNAGTISGNTSHGSGIRLQASASVTNQSGGTISGSYGVYAASGSATVANAGSIAGNALGGVGVDLRAGGLVTNQSGGVIDGYRGIEAVGDAATVTNAGIIAGDSTSGEGIGVAFFNGGTLTNQSGGTISGGLDAVRFEAGYNGRLVVDPGAVFIGTVTGGNTAGATAVTTLELAAGADVGTLTGLGSQFVGFAQSTIDSGASWTFAGSNTIGAGYTLTDDGTLTNTGTLLDAGTLIIAGTLITSGSINVAHYRALQLSPGGTLYNAVGGDIVSSGPGTAFAPVVFGAGGGDSTVHNLGTIKNVGGDAGVYLAAGGTITNGSASDTAALIYGALPIYVNAGRGTVTNFGTIKTRPSGGGPGMELNQGGIVVNGASGSTAASILGVQYGIFAVNGPTTLTNFGTIAASYGFGFDQRSGVATITNAGVIGATNGVGIALEDGGTIIDSGWIEGATYSVRFGGSGSNLLVLEQGYELFGVVQGSASASNTLELVGSVGAAVTVNYVIGVDGGLVNFQTVEFGPGAGNAATLILPNDTKLPGTIAGFTGVHDTIDLAALSDTGDDATTSFNNLTDVLTVTGDNGSVQLQLDKSEDYGGIAWLAQNDGNGGTSIHAENVVPLVISGATPGQTITDEETDQPFSGVTITDPNAPIGTYTLIITLTSGGIATDADGILSGTGLIKTGTGTYTLFAGNAAEATAELQALLFMPTAHQAAPGDSITTTFTIAAIDAVGVTASDSTTTVTATAVNDPPTITPSSGNTGVPNQTPYSPFTDLTVTDPDVGHVDTVTVMLSNPNGGVLSNLGGGNYDATTGVYTVTGMAADVTAALQGLVFTPTPPTSGFVSTTSFTVDVTGPGGSADNSSISVTSVQQVLGLAGTPTSQDVISVSSDGTGFAPPTPGKSNQAVVSDPSANASYTLPTGYQAEFLGGSAGAMLTDPSGGNALLVGNSGNDTIAAGAANDTLLGGSGNNTMSLSGANDIAGDASGNASVTASGLNDTFFAGTGALTAVASGSGDAIGLYTGDANVTLGGSGNTVYANSGPASIVATGSDDAIGLYTGNAALTVSGTNIGVYGDIGAMSVLMTGASNTIFGGSGAITATLNGAGDEVGASTGTTNLLVNGANATVFANAAGSQLTGDFVGSNAVIGLYTGGANLTLAGGNAQVFGNTGASNIVATGGGSDTIHLYTGASTITAGGSTDLLISGNPSGSLLFTGGAGASTILGAGSTTMLGGAGGTTTYLGQVGAVASFTAGAGNETLNAALSGGAVAASGSSIAGSADVLIGGAGNDTLSAGADATTMTGGGGANLFVFSDVGGGGTVTVTDFNANDTVLLAGYGAAAATNAVSGATASGGNTTITLSDNTRITFLDVSTATSLSGHVIST